MKKEMLHERRDFSDFRELVEFAGEQYADKYAYSFRRKPSDSEIVHISFSALRDAVRAAACELISMGCTGRHCAVIGKLSYEYAVMYFALLCAGAVIVPLDRDWHAEDLADTASKANAEFLFCDEDIADKAETVAAALPLAAAPYFLLADKKERNFDLLVNSGKQKYAENPALYHEHPLNPDALSLLVFTSGTTGKGKGVMLTQTAVLTDISSAIPYIDYTEKTIGVLPPHHTYGSSILFVGHIAIGAEIYVSSGLRYITKEMREQKPGHLVLVPLFLETFYRTIMAKVKEQGKEKTLFNMIKVSNGLRKIGIDRRKQFFKSVTSAFGGELKLVISGGAPINQEILDFFDGIGISTLNGYGITECAPLIAFTRIVGNIRGSVGKPIPVDTVRIDEPDEDGEGEILVSGPNVMLGYYNDEEATAAAMTEDGFFRTGDYGRLDGEILTITGRKKNLIILSNGKNVYPEEIENELIACPGILEIVVYEGKSSKGQEHNAIVAEIYPDADYCEKNGITDIQAHLKQFVDAYNKTAVPYKKIGLVRVRKTEFPKNTLRKIMRFRIDMTIE